MADDAGDNVRPFLAPDPDWMALLERAANGGDPWPTVANAMLILANDVKFKGMLGHDVFSGERVLKSAPPPFQQGNMAAPGPYPRGWTNTDVSLVCGYMQRVWGRKWTRATVCDALEAVAEQHPFHPVLEWIDGLKWDGVERIDTWLVKAFNPRNEFDRNGEEREYQRWLRREAYYAAIGSKLLIAAVRRLRQPGCKFDSMLILEGEQRIGKSTAVATLFGANLCTDTVFHDLRNKEAAQGLHGKWVVEFAEIDHVIRTDVETLKAFLSRATDHYRPPYERTFRDVPRAGVFIGTTNVDDYLRDTTGNTRVWPAPCERVDLEYIEANREQLWAEAAAREARGETVWLDTPELQQEAARLTDGRMHEDVWQPSVARWLNEVEVEREAAATRISKGLAFEEKGDRFLVDEPIFVARILEFALGMSKDKMTKNAQMRVADILKTMGWRPLRAVRLPKVKHSLNRGKTTVWRMPNNENENDE